jgi:hypothetical protein
MLMKELYGRNPDCPDVPLWMLNNFSNTPPTSNADDNRVYEKNDIPAK